MKRCIVNSEHLYSDEPHIQNIVNKIDEKLNLIVNDNTKKAEIRRKALYEIKIYAKELYFQEKDRENGVFRTESGRIIQVEDQKIKQ